MLWTACESIDVNVSCDCSARDSSNKAYNVISSLQHLTYLLIDNIVNKNLARILCAIHWSAASFVEITESQPGSLKADMSFIETLNQTLPNRLKQPFYMMKSRVSAGARSKRIFTQYRSSIDNGIKKKIGYVDEELMAEKRETVK